MVKGIHRPTRAIINLGAIKRNIINELERLDSRVSLFAVVKADAYGHGAVEVAQAAVAAGASGFCVAVLDEAIELREAGFDVPIIVLGIINPAYLQLVSRYRLSVTAPSNEWLLAAEEAYYEFQLTEKIPVHVKIDTGMGRIGFIDKKEMTKANDYLASSPVFELEGLYTHFATADTVDETYFHLQQQRFAEARQLFPEAIKYVHTANTATALWHDAWGSNMVRFGNAMYGLNPSGTELTPPYQLEEALSLETELLHVKQLKKGEHIGYGADYETQDDEWIGTIPVGYADGLRRSFSGYSVLIDGQEAAIVGRICMDQCMIRLPEKYPLGTKVTVYGKNGGRFNSIQKASEYIGTINYELPCNLSERVPRIYVDL